MVHASSAHTTLDVYRQRKPQDSAYYRCVEDYFEIFEQVYQERFERKYGFFRPYVRQVIYRYLDCGILKNGFARVRCEDCGHEYLLAHSCKRRHFCPDLAQTWPPDQLQWIVS
jgi:hypothetical protein